MTVDERWRFQAQETTSETVPKLEPVKRRGTSPRLFAAVAVAFVALTSGVASSVVDSPISDAVAVSDNEHAHGAIRSHAIEVDNHGHAHGLAGTVSAAVQEAKQTEPSKAVEVDQSAGHDHAGHSHDHSGDGEATNWLAFTAKNDRTLMRLYIAYLQRDPDISGLEYWRRQMFDGESAQKVSNAFASSIEFQTRYGHLDNEQFVDLIYRNVMERTADAEGRAYWINELNLGLTRGELMLGFSESPEFVHKTQNRAVPAGLVQFGDEDRRGQAALRRISYPWESKLKDWRIDFVPGRAGYYGITYVAEKRIVIFVRSSQSADNLAHVVAHEIGHAVDVTLNDGDDRRRWQKQRGIERADWWPSAAGAVDFASGAGDFAEGFADWQVSSGLFYGRLSGRLDARERALMAELAYD